jgi:hypothetical protein
MGRPSRGSDNNNMHFQGAIHLAFVVAFLVAYFNNREVRCLKLQYKGHCCVELLPDFVIENEIPTTVRSIYKNTQLCHTVFIYDSTSRCVLYTIQT